MPLACSEWELRLISNEPKFRFYFNFNRLHWQCFYANETGHTADRAHSFYERQQNASRVFAIVWASVRLSVCHTRDLYQNGASYDRKIFTVGYPKDSSLSWQNTCPWVRGFLLNEGIKEGYPLRRCYFAVIGSYSVKMVADKYRHAAYHNKH